MAKLWHQIKELDLLGRIALGANLISCGVFVVAVFSALLRPMTVEGLAYSHGPVWGPRNTVRHSDIYPLLTKDVARTYVVRVVVWNGSDKSFSARDISSTNGFRLTTDAPVVIKSAEVIASSRPQLAITATPRGSSIDLHVASDAAIERNDGFAIKATLESPELLTGYEHFELDVDLKGVSQDASEYPYPVLASGTGFVTYIGTRVSVGFGMLLFGLGVVIVTVSVWRPQSKRLAAAKFVRSAVGTLLSMLLFFGVYTAAKSANYIRSGRYPSWYTDKSFSDYYDRLSEAERARYGTTMSR
ncbi:MAG TPA: hypothetical protein VJU77_14510 [Chthoniobacterales bacterium]|nr:hypothetical protein [Chthoniobacterales bacterium]